ncbi:MAG: glycosyltransferase family 4 protein [Rhizomicrobium sp.]
MDLSGAQSRDYAAVLGLREFRRRRISGRTRTEIGCHHGNLAATSCRIGRRLLALFKGRPWLLEVRDLWPDSIVALDMMQERNLLVRMLRKVEDTLYRSAARVVTTNGGLRERLIGRGVPGEKIGVVPNGVDALQFTPRPKPQELLDRYDLQDRFVVGYIGTQGLAHDLETVLGAASMLRDRNVCFLFVGDGAQHLPMVRMVKRLQLDNVRFVRTVAADEVPDHIACCDALLVPLKRTSTLSDTMPSKIFEIAAMERPIIIGAEGIAPELVESHRAGIAVEPENVEALVHAIERLQGDASIAHAMQSRLPRARGRFQPRQIRSPDA